MPSNFLPVYGPGHEFLYNAPLSRVDYLIDSGLVRPVGKNRVRALVALCGASEEILALAGPAGGGHDTHKRETSYNPRGVWTFRRGLCYGT